METAPHHEQPRPAELAAAEKVGAHVETLKGQILWRVTNCGDAGLIPDEVPGLINTVRRRFTDLWKEGKIRPTDRTRENRHGNPETVWILGRDPKLDAQARYGEPGYRTSYQRLAKRVEELEDKIADLNAAGETLKKRLWYHAEHQHTHSYSDNCACASCEATRVFDALVAA